MSVEPQFKLHWWQVNNAVYLWVDELSQHVFVPEETIVRSGGSVLLLMASLYGAGQIGSFTVIERVRVVEHLHQLLQNNTTDTHISNDDWHNWTAEHDWLITDWYIMLHVTTYMPMRDRPLPNTSNMSTCVVNFFYQRFQSNKTTVFVRKHLSNRFAPYFFISGKDLIKYLSSVLIPIIDV